MAKNTVEIDVVAHDKATGVLSGIGKGLGGLTKIAGGLAVGGVVAGVGALGAGLASSVSEAMAAEEAQAQLQAVLKSTGGAAGVTAEMANSLAAGLQKVTRYEDDAIISGENVLLTFTNIGKDTFPQATEAMLDLSTAMGQDLQTSAVQVGKALNDPVAGMSALQRVGVTFTETQKESVKAMVEMGDTAGAQGVILAELQKEFGGSAVAAGETMAGSMDKLKNAFGDVKESVGEQLLPILADLAEKYGPKVIEWVEKVVPWLETNLPKAIAWMQQAWIDIQPTLKTTGEVIGAIAGAIGDVIDWLEINLPPAFETAKTIFNDIKTFLDGLKIPNPFGGLLDAIGSVIQGVKDALEWLSKLGGGVMTTAGAGTNPSSSGIYGANHAAGTSFARGGLSLVGERGPELVAMPHGARVFNNRDTGRMLGGGGATITVNVYGASDPKATGRQVELGVMRAMRAVGVS